MKIFTYFINILIVIFFLSFSCNLYSEATSSAVTGTGSAGISGINGVSTGQSGVSGISNYTGINSTTGNSNNSGASLTTGKGEGVIGNGILNHANQFGNKKAGEITSQGEFFQKQTGENFSTDKAYSLKLFKNQSSVQALKISSLEKNYLQRTKNKTIRIKQFGYNFFTGKPRLSLSIPVDKNYILGPGDELFIYVIGTPPGVDVSQISKLMVDREGKVYLPGLGVFYVWGKTLGNAEKLISNALKTNIKLTVGRLRTFPVYVSGEVRKPGAVIVTGVNTVIDAIIMAGGIKFTGTLRDIIVSRRTEKGIKKFHIDFYKLLLKGEHIDFRLKDGDVIFVKTIGKTAGITGVVKRPGIYEIKGKTTIGELINLAGGLQPSSYKIKVVLQRYKDNMFLEIEENRLDNKIFMNKTLKDGDVLSIKQVTSIPNNAVEILNYTTYPGLYEYKSNMKLSELLSPDLFFKDSNMNFGLIQRQYPVGSLPEYITFSPKEILNGTSDVKLMPTDKIYLFKYNFSDKQKIDFNKIKNVVLLEGEILYSGVYAYKDNMTLSSIFKKDMITLNTDLSYAEIERRDLQTFAIKKIFKITPEDILNGKSDVVLQPLDIVRFFPKYIQAPIRVTGKVKKSLIIPYHYNMKLTYALSMAEFTGNIKRLKAEIYRKVSKTKSLSTLEKAENIKGKLSSSGEMIKENIGSVFLYDVLVKKNPKLNITLNPGDRIVIKNVAQDEIVEKITLHGYVEKPGVYPVSGATTLYEILKKAGGFRKNAYPRGVVILRKSVKDLQRVRLTKAIIEMRKQIEKEEAGVMQADLTEQELRGRQAAFESKRKLLEEMKKTEVTGRITGVIIPNDIEKLKGTIYDIMLENGDEIYIPMTPSSVVIFGEVYNPSAMLYRTNFSVKDYIGMSGGLTKDADKSNIFVIKADGSVISSSNVNSDKFWEGRNLPEWGKPAEYSTEIMDYKLEPGDGIIVPTEVHVPTMWRPLIKDVTQIIYQGALTLYTISNLK